MKTLMIFFTTFSLLLGPISFAESEKKEVYTTKAYSIQSKSGLFLFFVQKGDKLELKSCDQQNCILELKDQRFELPRLDLRTVRKNISQTSTSTTKVSTKRRGSRSRAESQFEAGAAEPAPPSVSEPPKRRTVAPSSLKDSDLNFGASTCSCVRGTCRITSQFGPRSRPNSKATSYHEGLDIGGGAGTPIVASESGWIVFAGTKGGYGKTIDIKHTNTYTTRYGHMNKFEKTSGWVQKGEVIGYMGSTGNVTGPHLHFEIIKNGDQINPADFVSTEKSDMSKQCETVLAIGASSSGNQEAGAVR